MNIPIFDKALVKVKNSNLHRLSCMARNISKRHYKYAIVTNKTLIVVEGFPRCGNTFALKLIQHSFAVSNIETDERIAHHLHSIHQIKNAKQNSIPALVIIRHPLDAIISLLIRQDDIRSSSVLRIRIDQYLNYYIHFHQYILKNNNACVIVDFKEITKEYDRTLRRLNSMYDLNLSVIKPSKEIEDKLFKVIETEALPKQNFDKKRIAIPSKEKDDVKNGIKPTILESKIYPKALDLYTAILSR